MKLLATSYGASMVRQPDGTGEPGNAPASYTSVQSAAVSLPSRVAPSLTRMWLADVGPVPSNTSARDMATLTGCPHLRDRAATTGSR